MSEWISVTDQKPEESQRCIVWVECEKCRSKEKHYHNCLARGYNIHSANLMTWVGGDWNYRETNVTHWMPLPEGPK